MRRSVDAAAARRSSRGPPIPALTRLGLGQTRHLGGVHALQDRGQARAQLVDVVAQVGAVGVGHALAGRTGLLGGDLGGRAGGLDLGVQGAQAALHPRARPPGRRDRQPQQRQDQDAHGAGDLPGGEDLDDRRARGRRAHAPVAS
jgi:hypothetical protein